MYILGCVYAIEPRPYCPYCTYSVHTIRFFLPKNMAFARRLAIIPGGLGRYQDIHSGKEDMLTQWHTRWSRLKHRQETQTTRRSSCNFICPIRGRPSRRAARGWIRGGPEHSRRYPGICMRHHISRIRAVGVRHTGERDGRAVDVFPKREGIPKYPH